MIIKRELIELLIYYNLDNLNLQETTCKCFVLSIKRTIPVFGISTENGKYQCFACGASGHISKIVNNLRSNIIAEKIDNINEFEISAKIDTVSFSTKPSGNEVGAIRNRLVNVSVSKYTISELLGLITTGHTVSLSGAKTNAEWQGQQVIMVDLDNEYQGVTISDIVSYAKSIRLEPTFVYHTYSSTKDICRCRLGYVFKESIRDKQLYQAICNNLIKKFEKYCADTSCNDFCRLYFGTMNKDVYISNLVYYNRFSSELLARVENDVSTENDITSTDISKYFIKGKLRHDILAKDLIEKYHIIKLNNLPYFYDINEGIYVEGLNSGKLEDILVQKYSSLSINQRQEVIENIKHSLGNNKEHCDYHYIGFQNGILYLDLMEFMAFSPDIIITSKLTVNYVNHLFDSNEVVDPFFMTLSQGDKSLSDLYFRIIGVSCCATNKFHKTFVFYGNGGNGKGKFFDIIKALVGYDLYNCASLKQLANDRFAPADLLNKTVNICADDRITSSKIDTEVIKSCLSEDSINAQIKYGQPFKFTPVATFLVGTNYPLDLEDTSNAIDRRFVVIPMKAEFHEEDDNFDVNMTEKLTTPENLEYIAYKAMVLFAQVMRLGQFPIPDIVKEETSKQLLEFNTVKQFIMDNPFRIEKPKVLREKYEEYCKQEGLEPVSAKRFGIDMKNIKINGVKYIKRKLPDPEDGKYKNYYITSDYKTNETHNPMISRQGNDIFNDLVTAIARGNISQDDLQTLKEHIDNSLSHEVDLSDFEDLDMKI